LWSVTPDEDESDLECCQDLGFYSLLYLAQAIGRQAAGNVQITVVSNHLQQVTGDENVCAEKATLLGPCRVIPQEYPHVKCRSIDIVSGNSEANQRRLVDQLIREVSKERPEPIVAYRGAHRWIETFEPVQLHKDTIERQNLIENGVYVITGGFGGVGFAVAEYLARTVHPKLALIGRTAMPDKSLWADWLRDHSGDEEFGNRIRKIKQLEERGAEVLVLSADVSDKSQMGAAYAQISATFGRIHGVIHAAGLPGDGIIQLKTRTASSAVLRSKVQGTLILAELFAEAKFFVFCSSLRTTMGGIGQVDYCAANSFLDAFVHSRSGGPATMVSINWDTWLEVGMARDVVIPSSLQRLHAAGLEHGIQTSDGVDALWMCLNSRLPRIIVSVENLHDRLRRFADDFIVREALQELEISRPGDILCDRPALATCYCGSGEPLEAKIADVWRKVLGVEQVGVNDNFFELGGDSLLALQAVAELQNILSIRISATTLFERPTVSSLAKALSGTGLVEEEQALLEERQSRGERRRRAVS